MKNQPETHLIFLHSIAGQIARWAVQQSPYDAPDDLKTVISAFCERVRGDFKSISGLRMIEDMTFKRLFEMLDENLKAIPEFRRWNITKHELDQGYTDPEDPDRPVLFGIANSVSPPDHDFIDLDALIRNVAHELWEEARREREEHERYGGAPGPLEKSQ